MATPSVPLMVNVPLVVIGLVVEDVKVKPVDEDNPIDVTVPVPPPPPPPVAGAHVGTPPVMVST